jgi:hypothetical protein
MSVPASPDALSFVNSRKTELDYTPATLFHCELVSGKEFNRALKKTLDYFFEKRRSSHERSEEVLEWWCIDTLDEFSIVSQPSHLKTWKPKCSLQNHIDLDDSQRMENFNSVEYRGLDENTIRNYGPSSQSTAPSMFQTLMNILFDHQSYVSLKCTPSEVSPQYLKYKPSTRDKLSQP